MRDLMGRFGWLFAAMLTLLVLGTASASSSQNKWEYIEDDEGVRTWRLDIPGQDLPGFRGQTIIDADIDNILKVMLDWKSHTKWMYRCSESTLLKRKNDEAAIMYNRTEAPWPVWDRDVVVETLIDRKSPEELHVTFKNVREDSLKKVPEKVIRMPKLEGFYKLWQLGPKKTKIVYQVETDIGGSIPKWLAIRAAKDLPRITLVKLRERVTGKE
jgi:hypothetical protein